MRGLGSRSIHMAREAASIVGNGVFLQRHMRIVARLAAETRIAITPAFTFFQPIRLKARIRHSDLVPPVRDSVAKTAVA